MPAPLSVSSRSDHARALVPGCCTRSLQLEIDDESAHHLGHAGAASGGGHYTVTIVSERFRDRAIIARSFIMATAWRL
ncbi:MAG: BolA/IbaG family iron-sulfur metabolism protein [Chromatiales bacterium]